jgi:glucose-6-phosphate isomerase
MQSLPPFLDLSNGILKGEGVVSSTRHFADVRSIFENPHQATNLNDQSPIYTTHGLLDTGLPELLYATTIIEAGQVAGEYFMTRGHFHTNPERGEFNVTLSGKGAIVLMDRDRNTSVEWMTQGSIHNLDGLRAHRVVNVGNEPLIFLCVWMSDCGHDYESIAQDGFSGRLKCIEGKPTLVSA